MSFDGQLLEVVTFWHLRELWGKHFEHCGRIALSAVWRRVCPGWLSEWVGQNAEKAVDGADQSLLFIYACNYNWQDWIISLLPKQHLEVLYIVEWCFLMDLVGFLYWQYYIDSTPLNNRSLSAPKCLLCIINLHQCFWTMDSLSLIWHIQFRYWSFL